MAIDSAVSQTAVEAWDKRWATSEGRADWLEPPETPRIRTSPSAGRS
jgi:hypothetical protein